MIVEHIDIFDCGIPTGATASCSPTGVTRCCILANPQRCFSDVSLGGDIDTTFCQPDAPGGDIKEGTIYKTGKSGANLTRPVPKGSANYLLNLIILMFLTTHVVGLEIMSREHFCFQIMFQLIFIFLATIII